MYTEDLETGNSTYVDCDIVLYIRSGRRSVFSALSHVTGRGLGPLPLGHFL